MSFSPERGPGWHITVPTTNNNVPASPDVFTNPIYILLMNDHADSGKSLLHESLCLSLDRNKSYYVEQIILS